MSQPRKSQPVASWEVVLGTPRSEPGGGTLSWSSIAGRLASVHIESGVIVAVQSIEAAGTYCIAGFPRTNVPNGPGMNVDMWPLAQSPASVHHMIHTVKLSDAC